MRLVISGTDPPRPERDYFEVADTFFDITKITGLLILDYFHARADNRATKGPPGTGDDLN